MFNHQALHGELVNRADSSHAKEIVTCHSGIMKLLSTADSDELVGEKSEIVIKWIVTPRCCRPLPAADLLSGLSQSA